jgi:hypothetical protein
VQNEALGILMQRLLNMGKPKLQWDEELRCGYTYVLLFWVDENNPSTFGENCLT